MCIRDSCQYGQGYHFAKPMPIAEAEALLADEGNFDYRGIHTKRLQLLQIRELLNENLFSEILLNNILGGIAFYLSLIHISSAAPLGRAWSQFVLQVFSFV